MFQSAAQASVGRVAGSIPFQRHRPEQTLLYQIIERHYPQLVSQLADEERPLPDYIQREFEDYLKCGRLEHGGYKGVRLLYK